MLQNYPQLPDDAVSFARADWRLQYELTLLSGNPVFTLIYNSFTDLYESLAVRYFSIAEKSRSIPGRFILDLLGCAERCDGNAAEELVRQTMQSSRGAVKRQDHKSEVFVDFRR